MQMSLFPQAGCRERTAPGWSDSPMHAMPQTFPSLSSAIMAAWISDKITVARGLRAITKSTGLRVKHAGEGEACWRRLSEKLLSFQSELASLGVAHAQKSISDSQPSAWRPVFSLRRLRSSTLQGTHSKPQSCRTLTASPHSAVVTPIFTSQNPPQTQDDAKIPPANTFLPHSPKWPTQHQSPLQRPAHLRRVQQSRHAFEKSDAKLRFGQVVPHD